MPLQWTDNEQPQFLKQHFQNSKPVAPLNEFWRRAMGKRAQQLPETVLSAEEEWRRRQVRLPPMNVYNCTDLLQRITSWYLNRTHPAR